MCLNNQINFIFYYDYIIIIKYVTYIWINIIKIIVLILASLFKILFYLGSSYNDNEFMYIYIVYILNIKYYWCFLSSVSFFDDIIFGVWYLFEFHKIIFWNQLIFLKPINKNNNYIGKKNHLHLIQFISNFKKFNIQKI